MSASRLAVIVFSALVHLGFGSPSASGQDPCLTWTVNTNIPPTASDCNCTNELSSGTWPLAYDDSRGVTVMYGWAIHPGDAWVSRTWLFGGRRWAQCVTADTPSLIGGASIAYDPTNRSVIFFGGMPGLGGPPPTATWLWDGSDWSQIASTGPPGRQNFAMASDEAHSTVVLFGGLGPSWPLLDDTWVWDGSSWTQMQPANSPPARCCHAMSYDSARQVIVLFGGGASTNLNDTWEWDGTNWNERTPNVSPPPSSGVTMAYDAGRNLTVLVRGDNDNQPGEVWDYDGANWMRPAVGGPVPGPHGTMTYDRRRGKLVLYRTNYTGPQLWEYPASVRPFVVNAPVCKSICLGDDAAFSVSASGDAPLSYQWRRNGVDLNLPGANTPTLTIPVADFGSAGNYTVVVSNPCGSVESVSATLTVCAGASGCPSPVDVNGDGVVNAADIQRIVEILLGF